MATRPLETPDDRGDAATNGRTSIGRQALRREVNERSAERQAASGAPSLDIFCECGLPRCSSRVTVEAASYDDVRRFPTRFLVAEGHSGHGTERIVAALDGVIVVEKFGDEGVAAIRWDRRSRRAPEAVS